MAEFFLTQSDVQKDKIYNKCIENYYKAFDLELHLNYEKHDIPFENGLLNCIKLTSEKEKGILLVCGGYDSFIEEFVLEVTDFTKQGYTIILFEGPGQGRSLKDKMYFRYDWEKPTRAVLDYFNIEHCAMIGISWGGYLALRSAAFDKRISAAIAYDVMYDGFEVMTNVFPSPFKQLIRFCYKSRFSNGVNAITSLLRKKSVLADWAMSQGTYITGTKNVYDFYKKLSLHTMKGISDNLTQDILLLAGEKDHYIPANQYYQLKDEIHNAKTLTCRMYTKAEGGEQHCQIGNHMLAVNEIIRWLDKTRI